MALQLIQKTMKNGMMAAFIPMNWPNQVMMRSRNLVLLPILRLCFALVQPHASLLLLSV